MDIVNYKSPAGTSIRILRKRCAECHLHLLSMSPCTRHAARRLYGRYSDGSDCNDSESSPVYRKRTLTKSARATTRAENNRSETEEKEVQPAKRKVVSVGRMPVGRGPGAFGDIGSKQPVEMLTDEFGNRMRDNVSVFRCCSCKKAFVSLMNHTCVDCGKVYCQECTADRFPAAQSAAADLPYASSPRTSAVSSPASSPPGSPALPPQPPPGSRSISGRSKAAAAADNLAAFSSEDSSYRAPSSTVHKRYRSIPPSQSSSSTPTQLSPQLGCSNLQGADDVAIFGSDFPQRKKQKGEVPHENKRASELPSFQASREGVTELPSFEESTNTAVNQNSDASLAVWEPNVDEIVIEMSNRTGLSVLALVTEKHLAIEKLKRCICSLPEFHYLPGENMVLISNGRSLTSGPVSNFIPATGASLCVTVRPR